MARQRIEPGQPNEPGTGRRPPRRLSRRGILQAGLAAGLGGLLSSPMPAYPPRDDPADLASLLARAREMRSELQKHVRDWAGRAEEGSLTRAGDTPEDRFTYAVDVGQLMWFFAMAGDLAPYVALRDFAAKHLIMDTAKDVPFTHGFVVWRYRPGAKPDASGTTEALRIARALWTGAHTFDRKLDADLAIVILEGYLRHEATDQGIWLIRNYFNLASGSFATNSFFIDYDPDFVREVADAQQSDADRHRRFSELADHSYVTMRRAVSPSGLMYDILQPEVKTMYFDMEVAAFSPNDIVQTSNSCATAATVAGGDPDVARGTLAFVTARLGRLQSHYYGRTGERVRLRNAGAPEYAAAVRLAMLLGDRVATAALTECAFPYWERVVASPNPRDAWMASEVLLGLQAVLEFKQ